jgi:hypothetical protein
MGEGKTRTQKTETKQFRTFDQVSNIDTGEKHFNNGESPQHLSPFNVILRFLISFAKSAKDISFEGSRNKSE